MEARTVIGLCDRFKCLPSQLLAEDVSLIRMLKVIELAGQEGGSEWPT